MRIDILNISVLRVEDDFGYLGCVKRQTTHLPLAESAAGYTAGLKLAADKFNTAVDELDVVLEEASTVPSAKDASQKDAARDKAWLTFRNFVKASKAHPNAEIAEFATKTGEIFRRYGDLSQQAQQEESGNMDNLIQDLKALDTQKMNKAGFAPFLADMEQKETAYIAASDIRSSERGQRLVGIIKQKRAAADAAYRLLVDTVNALIIVNGDTAYATFASNLNGRIEENRALLSARRTAAEKRKKGESPKDPKQPKDPKDPKQPEGGGDDIHVPEEPPKKPDDGGGDDIHVPEEPPKKPDGQ